MVTSMVDLDHPKLTAAMRRTSEWISSQEIPSDVTVQAGGASFSLHKFPLVSKCGYIRKMVSESSNDDVSLIELPDLPGGAMAFELVAKFCYGINFEISNENIAALRCVAEYLEMTESYGGGNLVEKTEAYLKEVGLKSLSGAVSILQAAEGLGHIAEQVKVVSRCVDTIAYIACKDSHFCASGRADNGSFEGLISHPKHVVDWWAEDLTVLSIDVFQRVVIAMMARGFKRYALGPILMLYAQKSLRGLEMFGKGRKKIEPKQEHDKRVVLETIVSLLPKEKNALSVSFIAMLLRAALHLDTTVACRLDLEKRLGLQLGQAVLDDLLIPSFSFTGDTLFDVDAVQRIMINFLENEPEGTLLGASTEEGYLSPSPAAASDLEKVGKLMENYLAEIASDRNLSVSKFTSLAELLPEKSRVTEDGMYRGIDIYLKAHPDLSDVDRKKVCSVMDCQKLSREACAHAAQNDRLPAQTVVQVLYYEQQRIREVMNTSSPISTESPSHIPTTKLMNKSPPSIDVHPVSDELSTLKRENQDLKFELLKMKMRLKDMENSAEKTVASTTAKGTMPHAQKPPLVPRKSFVSSVSRKLGKLYPFVKGDGITSSGSKGRNKPSKDRRHSIS